MPFLFCLPSIYNHYVGRYYVENFGCRATQADGAAIERQLNESGMIRAASAEEAEVVVLNTCTVTSSADQDARAAIRRIHRHNPQARILVTGCYAQRAPQEIAALEGVSLVVGNSHKHRLAEIAASGAFLAVESLTAAPATEAVPPPPAPVVVEDIFAHTELMAAPVFDSDNEKTRPNLKVQDGCNNRCSFCVIPFVRGRSRSLPLGEVLRNVDQLVANGYQELVVSGINLGRWGRDLRSADHGDPLGRLRFTDLLKVILERTSVPLLRISSVEPMDWSDDLIALAAGSARIAKHAHVPLQSGSDRILRRMARRYRPWHYEDRIQRIHLAMPQAAIGADVMVGFPGETDDDFEETRAFIARLPFTYLHVFTYSSRPGMPSAAMPDQVPVAKARARNRILRELASAKKHEFQQQFVGGTLRALTLTQQQNGRTEALTDNYQKLWLEGSLPANRMLTARIHSLEGDALLGTAD
ncbi:MAG: tRNA (N(6)-L-threonylcarbamoyladenosine(37)-C(2))-methylthiotransferase MtaB [Acidobacteriota bacterium]|nr:tRNA (N(6)-L-threonylcarbamoyladenosine(37)-C(2))-methylthiotransferase MtaB [Acidobacteriota bacterium]